MKRIEIDKEIKAKSFNKATEKFARILRAKGYEWAADEMIESVGNNCFSCSNASEHNVCRYEVTHPKTNDWTYFWAIENIYENEYYAWFIKRI